MSNPFTTWRGLAWVDAESRLEAVKRFSIFQCRDALKVRNLQKTVRIAIERRIRKLQEKIAADHAWCERYKSSGKKLAAYDCPQCGYELETPIPPRGNVFDSAVSCPACEWLHFKVVRSSGKVEVSIMEKAS